MWSSWEEVHAATKELRDLGERASDGDKDAKAELEVFPKFGQQSLFAFIRIAMLKTYP